jgi:bidirectional [NiFe] hydrogenase diaphorase subunit
MKPDTALPAKDAAKPDPRMKMIAAKMKKENYKPDALIEVLHTAQNAYGYLPIEILKYISASLHLPPSRVFSTVTFYHFFSLKSKGEHTCLVCTGTACYVKGAKEILDVIEKDIGLKPGEVTADEKLGLQVARCIGACGLAPAVVIDDEVQPKMNAETIVPVLKNKILTHEQA